VRSWLFVSREGEGCERISSDSDGRPPEEPDTKLPTPAVNKTRQCWILVSRLARDPGFLALIELEERLVLGVGFSRLGLGCLLS